MYQQITPNLLSKATWKILMISGLIYVPVSVNANCLESVSLNLNSSHRSDFADAEKTFEIETQSPGILTVDAIQTASFPQPISLELSACGLEADMSVLERSAVRLTVAVLEAGTVSLRVTAEGTQTSLNRFFLANRFAPAEAHQEHFSLEPLSTDLWGAESVHVTRTVLTPTRSWEKTELEEVDPNPGAFSFPRASTRVEILRLAPAGRKKTELEEVDPNPGALQAVSDLRLDATWLHHGGPREDSVKSSQALVRLAAYPRKTELEEVDPNPGALQAVPSERLSRLIRLDLRGVNLDHDRDRALHRLTRAVEDAIRIRAKNQIVAFPGLCSHGGLASFTCAPPLTEGLSLGGELAADPDGGVGVFMLEVDELATFEVAAVADFAAAGALRDHSGRLLITSQGYAFNLTGRLEPGRYFVTIEGTGHETGTYELGLTRLR